MTISKLAEYHANEVLRSSNLNLQVNFTPTIPHCSMATLIGLAIRVKLLRSLSPKVKVLVSITPGSHSTEESINRQLADKVRLCEIFEIYLIFAGTRRGRHGKPGTDARCKWVSQTSPIKNSPCKNSNSLQNMFLLLTLLTPVHGFTSG